MTFGKQMFLGAVLVSLASFAHGAAITLTGTSFTQDFAPGITSAPTGFEGYTGAGASAMGTAQTPVSASSNSTTGQVRLLTDNNGGFAFRQASSFGDPGASLVFRAANTDNLQNFSVSFVAGAYDNQPRSAIYTVQWALGTNPTVFNTLGTIASDSARSLRTYSLPAAVNDQANNLIIRLVALTASTGSGNRDTFGFDNFSLTYSQIPLVPEPASLGLVALGSLLGLRRRR